MKALEEKIIKEGKVVSDSVLKVGNFLNQQIDTAFMFEIGNEIARLYKDSGVTKVITVEASGIAIAIVAASFLNVPMVFAKKNKSSNIAHDVYTATVESFTYKKNYEICVSSEYIKKDDKLLIVDDFLASGHALKGLIEIAKTAKAEVVGAAIAIEKGFQGGGDELRKTGMRVESLAIIDKMNENEIVFRKQ